MNPSPLQRIRVLDFSRLLPGPFCSLILSDLGAEVTKVEDPIFPDYINDLPPSLNAEGGVLYWALNRGKDKIKIALGTEEGLDVVHQLLKQTDVLIESYRPGVLKKLKLDPKSLLKKHPHLILLSLSGYGQKGSRSAGHDLNYQATAGVLQGNVPPSTQWADVVGGGLWGVISVLAALLQKKQTGKGMHLDVSLTHALAFTNLVDLALAGTKSGFGALKGNVARYHIYDSSDGRQMALAALEDKFWNAFCDVIKKQNWKDTGGTYPDAKPVIKKQLAQLFASKPQAYWTRLGKKFDICLTPVLSPSDAAKHLKMVFSKTGHLPFLPQMGLNTPIKVTVTHKKRSLLCDLGLSIAQIKKLKQKGILS